MKYKYLVLVLLTISCQKKKDDNNHLGINYNDKIIKELKDNSIERGDIDAYGRLVDYYSNNPSNFYEILPISIIVADKYSYDNAYASIFYEFVKIYNEGKSDYKLFANLNEQQRKYVLSYLVQGSQNKSVSSIGILEKLYREGIGVELNIIKADSLKKINQTLIYSNE
jgi:hypothetical protein